MNNNQFDLMNILGSIVIYIVGVEIGVEKILSLVILLFLNTIVWTMIREQYGITIGQILVKQLRELIVMFSLIFATKLVTQGLGVEKLTVAVYWAFVARLIFFMLSMAKREFGKNQLDANGKINNMIFAKLFKMFGEAFNLNGDMADINTSLQDTKIDHLKEDHADKTSEDKDIQQGGHENDK